VKLGVKIHRSVGDQVHESFLLAQITHEWTYEPKSRSASWMDIT
jgi:hypothetical protein